MTYEIGTILLYQGDPYLVRKEGISRWIKKTQKFSGTASVSYTHLTLPTILLV